MMLGSEDFSLDCGGLPTPQALMVPSLMLLHACRAAGIQPIGFIASIAELGEVEQFTRVLEEARALGFRGAVLVHPKFLEATNACYTPTPEQVAQARELIAVFEAALAEGLGAIKHEGRMIDKPVYQRALCLLREADLLSGELTAAPLGPRRPGPAAREHRTQRFVGRARKVFWRV